MDAYGLQSRMYDVVIEPLNAPLRRSARRLCPPEPTWTVLDVGCGTGTGLAEYAEMGCTVIGMDTSSAMLERARARLGAAADLRRVVGGDLPIGDGEVDLVVISLVLHSIPQPAALQLLRESARALAPGGRILITDFGTAGLLFPRGHVTRGLTGVLEVLAGPAHARSALAYLRSGGLPGLLPVAGLSLTAQRHVASGSITLAVAVPGS